MSDYLIEDLFVEILARLPVKSLLRFRTLSKSLCSIIGSPSFIRYHTIRSPKKVLIRHRIQNDDEEDKLEDFYTLHSEDCLPLCPVSGYTGIKATKFPPINFDIVGSLNGILCMYWWEFDIISLWNPSIRRKLTLPYQPCWTDSYKNHVGIVGFGYDSITDDYKIVKMHWLRFLVGDPQISSFVYSMKNCTWSEIASPTTPFSYVKYDRACFVNGKLHWLVTHHLNKADEIGHDYILTLDLTNHVFGKIMLPEHRREATYNIITIIKGSLALISTQDGTSLIWARRENTNRTFWSEVFKIKMNEPDEIIREGLQLTNGDFLFYILDVKEGYYFRYKVDNPEAERGSELMEFCDTSHEKDTILCVDSLELLGIGTAWEGKQPSFLGGEKSSKASQELEWKL